MRILLADDSLEFREFANKIFTRKGWEAVLVSSGEKAEEQLGKGNFDLAVLDFEMGPGLDGLDVAKNVLMVKPKQSVVIMSSGIYGIIIVIKLFCQKFIMIEDGAARESEKGDNANNADAIIAAFYKSPSSFEANIIAALRVFGLE